MKSDIIVHISRASNFMTDLLWHIAVKLDRELSPQWEFFLQTDSSESHSLSHRWDKYIHFTALINKTRLISLALRQIELWVEWYRSTYQHEYFSNYHKASNKVTNAFQKLNSSEKIRPQAYLPSFNADMIAISCIIRPVSFSWAKLEVRTPCTAYSWGTCSSLGDRPQVKTSTTIRARLGDDILNILYKVVAIWSAFLYRINTNKVINSWKLSYGLHRSLSVCEICYISTPS